LEEAFHDPFTARDLLQLFVHQNNAWSSVASKQASEACGVCAADGAEEAAAAAVASKRYRSLVDFDAHLADVTLDWLNPQLSA
jgi:hypothetical protein